MELLRDIDDTIVKEARILLSLVRKNGRSDLNVRSLADVPLLLMHAFELLSAEMITDRPFRTPGQQARTLQQILDTLEQILKLPMGHISGEGLATLDRRQLSDALKLFIDIIQHCYPEQPTVEVAAPIVATPEGRRLTLSQLETPELGRILFNMTSTPNLSSKTVRQKKPSVTTVTPKQFVPAKVTKPPAAFKRSLSTRSVAEKDRQPKDVFKRSASTRQTAEKDRHPKDAFKRTASIRQTAGKDIQPKDAFKRTASTRQTAEKDRQPKDAFRETNIESSTNPTTSRLRRPSVVSTKAKKLCSVSQSSPTPFSRNSKDRQPVKRGKVSSQTNSLCSSIKLLEEFDYINRRLAEIQLQKEKLKDIIKELEQEETRLQYVVSHIHKQAGKSIKKVPGSPLYA